MAALRKERKENRVPVRVRRGSRPCQLGTGHHVRRQVALLKRSCRSIERLDAREGTDLLFLPVLAVGSVPGLERSLHASYLEGPFTVSGLHGGNLRASAHGVGPARQQGLG